MFNKTSGGTGTMDFLAEPTEKGFKELENILSTIQETDAFKNYDISEVRKAAGLEASLKMVKYNQPELFDYLLSKEGPISQEQLIKDFKKFNYNEGTLKSATGNLHTNIYRTLDSLNENKARFLDGYKPDELRNVLDKIKIIFQEIIMNVLLKIY